MGSVFGRHNRTRGLGFFARTSCSYLPPSSHVYFQEQTLHYGGKNSILGLVIAMKQRNSDLLLQQCVRSAGVKAHFPD